MKYGKFNIITLFILFYQFASIVSFKEWSDRLLEKVEVQDGMDHVAQPEPDKPYMDCNCHRFDKASKDISLDTSKEDLNTRDEL
jgi:hypothetical protein